MRQFVTADLHFGHANIIEYCRRPFKDVYQMNDALIRNMNARIKEDDLVYHVGDFCFHAQNMQRWIDGKGLPGKAQRYIDMLNGQWICVRGNHDNNNTVKTKIVKIAIEFGGYNILMAHQPERLMNDKADFFLVGHIHNAWEHATVNGTIAINVGVDVNNFYPLTLDEAVKKYQKIKNEKIPVHTSDEARWYFCRNCHTPTYRAVCPACNTERSSI